MPRDPGPSLQRDSRVLRCLLVDADGTKRSFLAAAWTDFKPGFSVLTAATEDAALGWLESARPHIVAIGASIDSEAARRIVRAYLEMGGEYRSCVISESRPDDPDYLRGIAPLPGVQLGDPMDLEEVLSVGRMATEKLTSVDRDDEIDADVLPLSRNYALPDAEMGA